MANHLDQTVQTLREQILTGRYVGGDKLRETAHASANDVSRTVVRLSLSELEREGLVEREPNKGFRVRSYALADVADAILVRGELEGMAARVAAERGLSEPLEEALQRTVADMDHLLATGFAERDQQVRWIELNGEFHDLVVAASQNQALQSAIEQLSRLPLVSSRAIVFDQSSPERSRHEISRAQDDHRTICEAILLRQGARAEACMKNHALRSSNNKRRSIDAMRKGRLGPKLPGLNLVDG